MDGFVWEQSWEVGELPKKVTKHALVALPGKEGAHWGSSDVCAEKLKTQAGEDSSCGTAEP